MERCPQRNPSWDSWEGEPHEKQLPYPQASEGEERKLADLPGREESKRETEADSLRIRVNLNYWRGESSREMESMVEHTREDREGLQGIYL